MRFDFKVRNRFFPLLSTSVTSNFGIGSSRLVLVNNYTVSFLVTDEKGRSVPVDQFKGSKKTSIHVVTRLCLYYAEGPTQEVPVFICKGNRSYTYTTIFDYQFGVMIGT